MPTSPLKIGFNVPFAEAIKAAQQRKVVLPDTYYGELQGLARQQAFTVASLASLDQLTIVKDSLAATLQKGQTFRQWQKDITESGTLDLPKYRLDNIFRTNIQSNYNRGRWERFVESKATRPYVMYDAINDSRVRPAHLAMDGIIRPIDDAFWHTHAPLNGYRCRCRLISLSEGQAQARSGNGTGLNKGVDASKMEPDKGFDYNPGEDLLAGVNRGIESRAATAPAKLVQALDEKLKAPNTYWQTGTQQAPWHDTSFIDSPDWIKEAIKKHDGDFKGLLPFNPKNGAYHFNGSIHMAKLQPSSYKDQGTWRHEYGHYIDKSLAGTGFSHRSAMPDFTQAMNNDTDAIIKASGLGRKSAKLDNFNAIRNKNITDLEANVMALSKEERKSYLSGKAEKIGLTLDEIEAFFVKETVHIGDSIARDIRVAYLATAIENKDAKLFMGALSAGIENLKNYNKGLIGKFSDTIGSASKNKLLGMGTHGNGGHTNKYYNDRAGYGQQTEVFANLTCLIGSNSKVWEVTMDYFYPTLATLFKDILK